MDVPNWQSEEVRKRLQTFGDHPEQAVDFASAMDDIEKAFKLSGVI